MSVVFVLLLLVAIFVFLVCRSQKSRYSLLANAYGGAEGSYRPLQHSTAFHTVGHRPPTQDFLPTVGEEPLGEGDHLLESDPLSGFSMHTIKMCNDCVSTCTHWISNNYNRSPTSQDQQQCWEQCRNSCM